MSLADLLTLSRIPLSLALLWLSPFSAPFTAVYVLCGLTDVLDGFLARRMHTESDRGARLDTAADTVFLAVWLLRLLPALSPPRWVWLGVGAVAAVKGVSLLIALRRDGHPAALHIPLNRLCGVLLFALPFTRSLCPLSVSAGVLIALTLLTAAQELRLVRAGKF